ncbi:hypothetical protein M3649_03540 [Ureibacillus chungkukjangi]|uniref:hypothetical protein n=1 Tax=Ureibacillus chungkukjangi TaxID=1202712 RepID=UPI00203FA457|nr:hypothetical protein [Ureibacillus chungkukjangi]MCM3387203.1 hypothetical protein [Ureibacillus chungkukjangi]
MDYSKLHWQSDWMKSEVYGDQYEGVDDTVVGYYTLVDFPEINLYIDTEEGKILEVWLSEED